MEEFTIKAGGVNVETIMQQIRDRIRAKKGIDYTEAEIREIAQMKLEAFLDPKVVRSDLLPLFQAPESSWNFEFDAETLFKSSRGMAGRLIVFVRRLLNPVLKLFFNPTPLMAALSRQSQLNRLYVHLIHNLVVELTRVGVEVKNLRIRVDTVTGRLDYLERRSRALEGAVEYRPGAQGGEPAEGSPASVPPRTAGATDGRSAPEGQSRPRSRRRRRRWNRRNGAKPPGNGSGSAAPPEGAPPAGGQPPQ